MLLRCAEHMASGVRSAQVKSHGFMRGSHSVEVMTKVFVMNAHALNGAKW